MAGQNAPWVFAFQSAISHPSWSWPWRPPRTGGLTARAGRRPAASGRSDAAARWEVKEGRLPACCGVQIKICSLEAPRCAADVIDRTKTMMVKLTVLIASKQIKYIITETKIVQFSPKIQKLLKVTL